MNRSFTIFLTGLAPAIWGSTYLVTTQMLPADHALTNAYLRALPAGILLLLITRRLPRLEWLPKLVILGALNFSIFWWLLFEAAYRLPGGVAATVGSTQPLLVYALSALFLGTALPWKLLVAGLGGVAGVALLTLTPDARLDAVGLLAAFGGALSMAVGVVLSRRWQLPVSPLSFASWQLIVGGALILPFSLMFEQPLPALTSINLLGYVYLGVIGGAVTYVFWFRGIAQLGPSTATTLGFLSPVTAVLLGWVILGQALSIAQMLGVGLVLASVYSVLLLQKWASLPPDTNTATDKGNMPSGRRLKAQMLAGDARRWRRDPLSHPDIRKMSPRELADLPYNSRIFEP